MNTENVVAQVNTVKRGKLVTSDKKTNSKRRNVSSTKRASSKNSSKGRARRKAANGRHKNFAIATIAGAISVSAIVVGVIAYMLWYFSFTEIKLADYSSVTIEGYDKYGSAKLLMNGDSDYAEFFKTVSASLDMTENLSNGDELIVKYVYDADLAKASKLRVDDADACIVVDGLMQARVIDHAAVFDKLVVTYEGMSPCMAAIIDSSAYEDDEFLSMVTYEIEGDKLFFEGGDEFYIRASIPEELYDDHAYDIQLTESDYQNMYTAPYGDSYFTDANQITDEVLDELVSAGLDMIYKADAKEYGLRIFQQEAHLKPVFVGNTTTFKWVNPYMISAYFHSATEQGKQNPEAHANDVQIVYGVTLTQQDGTSCLTEMVIQFINLVECEDGSDDLNLSSGKIISATYKDSNIKNLVNNDNDGMYVTTKLTD